MTRLIIGEYKYRDVLIPDGVPRIISDDTFLRVQERVAKKRYAPGRLSANEEYLLTTKLCCGECGAYSLMPLWGYSNRSKKRPLVEWSFYVSDTDLNK